MIVSIIESFVHLVPKDEHNVYLVPKDEHNDDTSPMDNNKKNRFLSHVPGQPC